MNVSASLICIVALSICAAAQTKLGQPVPLPAQWLRDGRLIVPEDNFSIASPSADSHWSYTENSVSANDQGVVFIVEYSPGKKYVVMIGTGGRAIDANHPEEFLKGMQMTLPKDWAIQESHLEVGDIPLQDTVKFKVKLDAKGSTFYSYGYIVSGRRDYMFVAYSKEQQEPIGFTGFVRSFSLLSPAANVLPPPPPHSPIIGIMTILAIAGAVTDRRYKRRGGRKPTGYEYASLWAALAVCIAVLVALGAKGTSSEDLGRWIAIFLMLVFSFWELGRWVIRRKYPLPSTPEGTVILS